MANGLYRQPLRPLGMPVDGEDVDIDAPLLEDTVVAVVLVENRAAVSQLGILEEIVSVGLSALQSHRIIQLPRQYFHHPLIILPEHLHVHVIVPRDEPPVACRSQQGTAYQPITDAMLLANGIEGKQQVHHAMLLPAEQRTLGIETLSQLLITICLVHLIFYLFTFLPFYLSKILCTHPESSPLPLSSPDSKEPPPSAPLPARADRDCRWASWQDK